ncbi:hypothetical protein ABPG74_015508 [Tetrahymena malaccensis]
MEFQIFQDIPQRLTELNEGLLENVVSATYHWTLCLYGHQNQVLNVLNMSKELIQLLNSDSEVSQSEIQKCLEKEIVHLSNILPRGVRVNGIISVLQDEKFTRSSAFNTLKTQLKSELTQQEYTKEIFANNIVQFLYSKKYRPYMKELEIECLDLDGVKQKLSALKHSSTNDILKSYYMLTTYFKYPSQTEPLNLIMFAKVNNDFVIVPRGSQCIVQQEVEEVKEDPKASGKSKKQNKQPQAPVVKETNQDKMNKLITQFKADNKKNIDEIGKGIALIKVQSIEVSIFSKIYQPENQQTITLQTNIENTSKYNYLDCISYVKTDAADHEVEIQNHLQYFFEQIRQTEGKSIFVYGLLDLPLCTQGVIDVSGNEPTVESKKYLHFRNLLPSSFASFRFCDRLQNTKNIGFYKKEKIRNVHKFMPLKSVEGARRYQVQGNYIYHHYMQDGFNDDGWGCAYRSLQSVLSWFIENKYVDEFAIPTHKEIQSILVAMQDKPSSFIGTSEWIGAFEVQYVIQKLVQCECKFVNVSSGSEVPNKVDEFKEHFLNEGTPIMFGGGVKAFSLMGIDHNEQTGELRFLIMDPHYTGSDNPSKAVEKGGISWQKADLFLDNHFYNFCMPIRKREF